MKFTKYQALGNDYLVVDPTQGREQINGEGARQICDRHYGVGADGLLFGPLPATQGDFALRFFNPDGGEFEKSGNGLRIFARYLWDTKRVGEEAFSVQTPGGLVHCRVHPGGEVVTIEMGRVSFLSREIPVLGPDREVLNEILQLGGEEFRYCAATIGNPHCVVIREEVCEADARRWGPLIEVEPRFPRRTNVQFMQVLDRGSLRIEIWERGVGYTLASGSSSCAAAAVACRLGYCAGEVRVFTQGGSCEVSIGEDYLASVTGAVTKVCEGSVVI